MKFLLRYPEQTVELFLNDGKVQDQQWNRFFEVLTVTSFLYLSSSYDVLMIIR